jgi:hypothetical protein
MLKIQIKKINFTVTKKIVLIERDKIVINMISMFFQLY